MDATLSMYQYNGGFLGSFLSNSLKTTQLEVNTDAKTLRPIARLKEPRDLFALPKDKDHDCPQQAARWPTECQVLDERIYHLEYVPETPEIYYKPTGNELQPRPVGEENGVVVFSYNPVSAVNYTDDYNLKSYKSETDDDGASTSSDTSRVSSPTKSTNKNKIFVGKTFGINVKQSDDDIEENDDSAISDNEEECPFKITRSESNIRTSTSDDTDKENIVNSNIKRSRSSPPPLQHIKKRQYNNSNLFDDIVTNQYGNRIPQFSRSSVGGSKYLLNVHPSPPESDDLLFESRFESGNLAKAIKITPAYYELYLRSDMYTNRHTQWFYFRVMNTKKDTTYRFSIVNLAKSDSLYNEGMRPLMYSTIDSKEKQIGWRRCGDNISYFKNDDNQPNNEEDEEYGSHTLTFNIKFQHDMDTVYFAHSYPYTYTELQDYLMAIQRHPSKSKYCKLRLLCRSLAGNNIYYLTVTAPQTEEENPRKKRAVVITARVHPGETPSSWMMKGFMDFITGDSFVAKKLRHKFIFKLIPMLNPDGVIVGNTRNSLTGKDLNRQYRTVIRETYPSIWYTKAMIKRLMEECGVVMYCDMHAHSRKHNIFIYGCENRRTPDKRLIEQVFPLMLHKNVADKFSFENCKFKVQRNKEGTGRIVVWMLGITNSYTMEASFGGTTMGARAGTHFCTMDFEHLGRAFCETLMDYYDENPLKERLKSKILTRLEQEGSSADEPLNIPLSDYSSDEGDTSGSSENEGKNSIYEGPCCQPLKVPPSSPVLTTRQLKYNNKKNKKIKSKVRRADMFKGKNMMRQILEMPTTDPGGDFFHQCLTTEDEDSELEEYDRCLKVHRQMIRSDCTKKTPFLCNTIRLMPPELIIRSAKTDDSYSSGSEAKERKTVNNAQNLTEFPPINTNRRTKTWHNFNRYVSTIKGASQEIINYETTDNLQMKLSLKKKLWTGSSDFNLSRPLSWGIPPIIKIPVYDSHALLEACSQKLAMLQESENRISEFRTKSIPTILRNLSKSSDTSKQKKYFKVKPDTKEIQEISDPTKEKKKPRVHLNKIVESTEIISRLAKSTKLITSKKQSSPLCTNQLKVKVPNKFKTGGLVATAVQPVNKNKKNRSIPHRKCIDSCTESENSENVKIFVKKVKTKLKKKKTKPN